MKKFFAFLTLLFIFPLFVNAKEADIQIKSVELVEKTDTAVEKEEAKFEDLEIWFNLKFTKLNDSAKYKVVVKNTSKKDYKINKDNTDFTDEEYIKYLFDYDNEDDLIKAGTEETFYVTITYDKEVSDEDFVNGVYVNDNYMNLNFSTIFENPKTGDNIITYVILGGISLVLIIILGSKAKAIGLSLIALVLLVPMITKAVEEFKIDINAKVEIEKGPELGTFSLCDEEKIYQFELGMSLKEWFDSPYNVDELTYRVDFEDYPDSIKEYGASYIYKEKFYTDRIDDFKTTLIENNKHYYCYTIAECVSPESEIMTSTNGDYKLAKNIKENDKVVYYDFDSNTMKVGKIGKVYVHKDATNFIRYTLEDGTYIEATDYHPIYTKDGFKSYTNRNGYEKPVVGDEVLTNNGYKKITKIELYNGKEDFVDFMILDNNGDVVDNYYANGILVHSAY